MFIRDENFAEETFNEFRPLLFAIAFRMLGSWMDAEDVVQEAFLRWCKAEPGTVSTPKAYLSAVVTRLSIDQLRSARVKREQYIGPWLPDPALASEPMLGADPAVFSESLTQAFLVVLETLSPIERAVFLLREVFDYPFEEIASIVDKNPANCRQIARRCRQHVNARRPRFEPSSEEQDRLLNEFVGALASGDIERLTGILADDARFWADGGGKMATAMSPLEGADTIARRMIGFGARHPRPISGYRLDVPGQPIFVSELDGQPLGAVTFGIANGRIQVIHLTVNPDKLRHLAAVWPEFVDSGQARPVIGLN